MKIKRGEGILIEYHKIQKGAGSQSESRCVTNSQRFYLCNKVEASRHNAKDQLRIRFVLTDKISYSSS